MEAMMYVGVKTDKQSVDNITDSVVKVLQTAYETLASEAVALAALGVIKYVNTVENISISGCTLSNDTSKKVVVNVPEDYEVQSNQQPHTFL